MHSGNVETDDMGAQRGYPNALSAISWVQENFPSLSSLVISGSSAGALAVQYWSSYVLHQLSGRGQKHSAVLSDSFAGVGPPSIQPELMRRWNMCETVAMDQDGLQERCRSGNMTIQDMWLVAMEIHPQTRFTSINSKTDLIQLLFYDIWVNTEDSSQLNIEGIRYLVGLNDIFRQFNEMPNYASFLLNGAQHTFLDIHQFYTADPVGEFDRGVTAQPLLSSWVQGVVDSDTSVSTACHGIRLNRDFWSTYGAGVLYCDAGQADKLLVLQANSSH